jgi:hypothetical protein
METMTDSPKSEAKKTKAAAEQAAEAVAAPFESLFAPFKNAKAKFEIPTAARDFVLRATEAGKERAETLQANANKVTETIQSALARSIDEAALVSRNVIKVAHEDATAALAAVEKLAAANSLSEVVQVQVDYARERSEVAAARARNAFDYVTTMVAERAKGMTAPFAGKTAA